MILIEMIYKEGNLWLSAPGKEDLMISPEDLKYSQEKEISVRMLDIDMKTILVGKKYDQFFSEFLLGKHTD